MWRRILLAGVFIVALCSVSVLPASASTPKPPTIKSFSPTSGTVGTEVTIHGTKLAHATKVTFNGTIATVISDHAKIKVHVPVGATTGHIEVETPKGTAVSVSTFTVVLDRSSTATNPASSSIVLGNDNSDSAVVSGNATYGSPTGTVTFYECGPTASPESCTSKANQVGSPVGVTTGANETSSASSVSFTPSSGGYWCFAGDYSGDSNYAASSDTTTDECFDVTGTALSSTATTPASLSIVLGNDNSDSAVVSGDATYGSPTGTVTFYECGPTASPEPCTSQADRIGSPVGVTTGANDTSSATSVSFTPSSRGYWCFAGYYSGDSNYAASSDTTTDECFDVIQLSSTSTSPASTSIGIGYDNSDSALVSGNATYGSPTGTVTFYECGPTANPEPCASQANEVGSPVSVTAGANDTSSASSASFAPSSTGYWCFAGYYSGDSNYAASSDTTTDECFDVYTPLPNVISVVSDDNQGYCALLTSQEVDCWGSDENGQLGNGGKFANSDTPVAVESVGGTGTLTGVTSLVGNGESPGFCALLTSGGVDCWGNGYYGQLGNGTFYTTGYDSSNTPVEVEGIGGTGALSGVTSLIGGENNYCALLTSGGVDCWGDGYYGELGNGTFYTTGDEGSATPVEVEGVGGDGVLTGVTSLVAANSGGYGVGTYCAVLTTGGVDCWGYGYFGQLGNGTFYTTGDEGSATPGEVEGVGGAGVLTGVTSLTSDGDGGYCAVLTSGGVDCWGLGDYGQLGNGTFYTTGYRGSDTPVEVEGVGGAGVLTGVASLVGDGDGAYGGGTYCAVLTSGGVDCWGSGDYGTLGDGNSYPNSPFGTDTPVEVEGVGGTGTLTGVASVAADTTSYCALLTSGGMDCWGNGEFGQLGNGTFYTTGYYGSDTPVGVEGVGGAGALTGVTNVVGDTASYCALLTSGGADCWGEGGQSTLGNGSTSSSATPVEVG
jgi:alpha-tubulin suppressor-like RCC1 family protein